MFRIAALTLSIRQICIFAMVATVGILWKTVQRTKSVWKQTSLKIIALSIETKGPPKNASSVRPITRFQSYFQARARVHNVWKQEPNSSQGAKPTNFFQVRNSSAKSATLLIPSSLFTKHKPSFHKNASPTKTSSLNVWGIFRSDCHAHMIVTVAAQDFSWQLWRFLTELRTAA
jgi:hypothetical protein